MKTVLVTGGNRGIGLAIVKELAKNSDDKILLGCRDMNEGRSLASEIGINVIATKVDLSDRKVLSQNVKDIIDEHSGVDVLINNAGILKEGNYLQTSFENLDETLRVNVLACYELIKAFAPKMIEKQYGRIVNVSSGWGSFDDGLTGPFSYSLSKAALNALTVNIAKDLPRNVKINSMCPGWVRTRMGGMTATRSPEQGAQGAVWLANLDENGPSGGFFRDQQRIAW